jgi:hypothetical protein
VDNHVKPETASEALDILFRNIRLEMNREEMPRIILRKFGTFAPILYNIEKEINKLKEEDNEKNQAEISRLEKVAQRLEQEKASRRVSGGESGEVSLPDGYESDL